jgi:hypothetical protein
MFWDGAAASGYTNLLLLTLGMIGLMCVTFVVDHPYSALILVALWLILAVAETIRRRA